MTTPKDERVIVIGGGIAGIVAAYTLGKAGLPVTLIEGGSSLGGLASSFEFDGKQIERFYHFICKTDEDYFELLEELEIADALQWATGITSFFYEGDLYRFATPFDLMGFKPVSLFGRIRFGISIVRDRFRHDWELLDAIPARAWLITQIGQSAYNVIWDPLLRIKFGAFHDQISAAWVWHRIHRVAKSRDRIWEPEQLGYLMGGTQTLIDALAQIFAQMPNIHIRLNESVAQINTEDNTVNTVELQCGEKIKCLSIISTIALNQLKTLVDDPAYKQTLAQYTYIGVVCGLLKLKEPVTYSFWVNINDQRIPFNGIIEYTNLNSHIQKELGAFYTYVPHYLQVTDPRMQYSDERLLEEYIAGLKLVNPEFDRSWIIAANIARSKQAQAICGVRFKEIMPEMRTPIEGLFITDSTLCYPEDRTVSASIRLGKRSAKLAIEKEMS
jgi:protoporphyrinogen oxidase